MWMYNIHKLEVLYTKEITVSSNRDGTKPGLWTMDWTMDLILDSILDSIGQ